MGALRGLDASSTSRVARVGGCKVVCRPSKNNLLEASVGKSYFKLPIYPIQGAFPSPLDPCSLRTNGL